MITKIIKPKYTLLCLPLFLLSYCRNTNNSNSSENIDQDIRNLPRTEVKINPTDTTSRYASELFDSVTYIPLETTSESLFSKIYKMEVTDTYFIIHDQVTNSILFFLKSGKFSHKISNYQLTVENSYKIIGEFALDRAKNELIIMDIQQGKLIVYSLSGKRLRKENYPFMFNTFYVNNDYRYFFRSYENIIDKNLGVSQFKNLVITDRKEIKKSYLPYDPEVFPRLDLYDSRQAFFYSGPNSLFLSVPGSYSIYQFNEGRISNFFQVVLPQDFLLPPGFLTDKKFKSKRIEFIKDNEKVIWNCTDFYTVQSSIIAINLQSIGNFLNSFLYDTQSAKYIKIENIICDKLNYALPICERNINGSDGNSLYSSVSSKLMLDAVLKIGKSKALLQNKVLSKYFESSTVGSNPVITKIDVKPSLK